MQARWTEGAEQGGAAAYGWGGGGKVRSSGDLAREGNRWSGGGLAMAHLPLVRHKYDDSDGAPPPGAPLEFCFDYSSSTRLYSP